MNFDAIKDDLMQAGIPQSHLKRFPEHHKWRTKLMEVVAEQRRIRRLLPEHVWKTYQETGIDDAFEEVKTLRAAYANTRKVWRERPKNERKTTRKKADSRREKPNASS